MTADQSPDQEGRHGRSAGELAVLEVMAKAMYDARVQQARKTIAGISLPFSRIEETLVEARDCGDDRTAVIVLFALIEDLLIDLIKNNMNVKLKGGLDKLFVHPNILSTASARITISAALDWISSDVHSELDILRKMRNEFAHKVRVRNLSDEPIAGLMSGLTGDQGFLESRKAALKHNPNLSIRPVENYNPRQRLVLHGAGLVNSLCFELPSRPLATRLEIQPSDVFGSYDDMPESVRELRKAIARAVLPILIVDSEKN